GWTLGAALARQLTDDELRLWVPRQCEAALGKIELAGDVEKRRKQAALRHFVGIHQLRNTADVDAAWLLGGRSVAKGQRRIRGSQVDANDVFRRQNGSPLSIYICRANGPYGSSTSAG